jgi:uncharacterized protein YqfB (UPF0267 family)
MAKPNDTFLKTITALVLCSVAAFGAETTLKGNCDAKRNYVVNTLEDGDKPKVSAVDVKGTTAGRLTFITPAHKTPEAIKELGKKQGRIVLDITPETRTLYTFVDARRFCTVSVQHVSTMPESADKIETLDIEMLKAQFQ